MITRPAPAVSLSFTVTKAFAYSYAFPLGIAHLIRFALTALKDPYFHS